MVTGEIVTIFSPPRLAFLRRFDGLSRSCATSRKAVGLRDEVVHVELKKKARLEILIVVLVVRISAQKDEIFRRA